MNTHRILRRLLRPFGVITRVQTSAPAVALTFDDGPDPLHTPRLLDVLAAHDARATFFLDGPAAAAHPAIVQRIEREGHAVGVHGWSHRSAEHEAEVGTLRSQISEIRQGADAVGQPSRLYRPPYGHESLGTRLAAVLLRYQLVYWSASIEDWDVVPSSELASKLADSLSPGAVILLHDRLRHAKDPRSFDRSYMVDAVAHLLARGDGAFSFLTLPELVAAGEPVVRLRRNRTKPLPAMSERFD